MQQPELNVVIPVYNEQGAINVVLDKWVEEFNRLQVNFNIHVYNDGSKDNTLSILQEYASGNNKVVVHDKLNSGHGSTILQGYRENINSEWLFQIDSDDEMSPESFEKLWIKRNEYDFLIGSRTERNNPLSRKLITMFSRLTVWGLYGKAVKDVNSPYRLMKTSAFKDYYSLIPPDTFAPNVIISGICGMKKLKVYEIEANYKFRTTGEVSIKKFKLFKSALKSFIQTILFRFKIIGK
ncbi:MAG: glycosyltransferase family 2 protein [Vampirovibrionia bacterium]